jgi:hypothetical protein
MLLDFGNKWIHSLIAVCCLFSQEMMVEVKDLLESLRSNNGGEREVSTGGL